MIKGKDKPFLLRTLLEANSQWASAGTEGLGHSFSRRLGCLATSVLLSWPLCCSALNFWSGGLYAPDSMLWFCLYNDDASSIVHHTSIASKLTAASQCCFLTKCRLTDCKCTMGLFQFVIGLQSSMLVTVWFLGKYNT